MSCAPFTANNFLHFICNKIDEIKVKIISSFLACFRKLTVKHPFCNTQLVSDLNIVETHLLHNCLNWSQPQTQLPASWTSNQQNCVRFYSQHWDLQCIYLQKPTLTQGLWIMIDQYPTFPSSLNCWDSLKRVVSQQLVIPPKLHLLTTNTTYLWPGSRLAKVLPIRKNTMCFFVMLIQYLLTWSMEFSRALFLAPWSSLYIFHLLAKSFRVMEYISNNMWIMLSCMCT